MGEAFVVLFSLGGWAAMFMAVTFVISHIGGWSALAQQYRCEDPFPSTVWKYQRAQFRWFTAYNNCVTFGADQRGLYIAVSPLFRVAHPPLFIPWHEISVSRRKSMWVKQVRFQVDRDLRIPISVRETLGEKIRAAAGAAWPEEVNARSQPLASVQQ